MHRVIHNDYINVPFDKDDDDEEYKDVHEVTCECKEFDIGPNVWIRNTSYRGLIKDAYGNKGFLDANQANNDGGFVHMVKEHGQYQMTRIGVLAHILLNGDQEEELQWKLRHELTYLLNNPTIPDNVKRKIKSKF